MEEEDAVILDPCGLTDDDLKAALLKHGFKAGPIVGKTALQTVLNFLLFFFFLVETGFWSPLLNLCVSTLF